MREQLLGYLLGALDDSEHQQVEDHLRNNPQAQQELEILSGGLLPLEAGEAHHEPPQGLAQRACQAVETQRQPVMLEAPHAPRRWSLIDVAVAGGLKLAAAAVFFPAVNYSRAMARRAGCEDNLRQIGAALVSFSNDHGDHFPSIQQSGPLSVAGVTASRLVSGQHIAKHQVFVCPSSEMVEQRNSFRVPTISRLMEATVKELA
jgi:hypothetical protein